MTVDKLLLGGETHAMSRFQEPGLVEAASYDDEVTLTVRQTRNRALRGLVSAQALERRLAREGVREERTDAVSVLTKVSSDGAWIARWVFTRQGPEYVTRALTLEPVNPDTPAEGLTASLLRELSPSKASAEVAAGSEAAESSAYWVQSVDDGVITRLPASMFIGWAEAEAAASGPAPKAKRRPGRPALSDELLAGVAEAYLFELRGGRGVLGRVRDRIASQTGRPPEKLPVETIRDWVRICRVRGFLQGATQGRRGAAAGPRLIQFRTDALRKGQPE